MAENASDKPKKREKFCEKNCCIIVGVRGIMSGTVAQLSDMRARLVKEGDIDERRYSS